MVYNIYMPLDRPVPLSAKPSNLEQFKIASRKKNWLLSNGLSRYAGSIALVISATMISELFGHEISPANLVMVYLLAVVLAAVYLGRGPSVLASISGVLAFDYFFVSPRFSFSVADTEYLLTFSGLLIVGWVISYLTIRAREQADAAQRRETDTAMLYALSRDLAAADGLDDVLSVIRRHTEQSFAHEATIFVANEKTQELEATPNDPQTTSQLHSALESEAAASAFKTREPAGLGTNNVPTVEFLYLPLTTARKTVGVLGIKPEEPEDHFEPDQRRLLDAFASQSAQAIERMQLAEQARQVKLLKIAEKLQNALINSISHDLRTPLVSITGALTAIEHNEGLDEAAKRSLIETAREEADRLNQLVGNLLDMTRLESGALQVKRELCDPQDLVGAALGQIENRLVERPVSVNIDPGIPLVPMDFVLIAHVLSNLLDNALKYSPAKSPIEIQARLEKNELQISIIDHGIGIPAQDFNRVFDKFFRVQRPKQAPGTGLGLAISKGIIEAHGGKIWAGASTGGGAVITFSIPLEMPK